MCILCAAYLAPLVVAGCDPTLRYHVLSTVFDDVPPPGTAPPPRRAKRSRRQLPKVEVADAEGTPTPSPTPAPKGPPILEASKRGWDEAMRLVPKSITGGPDWMAALRLGVVRPRSSLDPGGGAPPAPLLLDVELEPDDARMQVMKVVFPHAAHTQWLMCPNCHTGIFQMKKGADPITMSAVFAGDYCGRCHGKMAFDLGSCPRCHVNLVSPKSEVVQAEVARAHTNPVSADVKLVQKGKAIYELRCAICHGDKGDGKGPAAEFLGLNPKPRDFIPGKYRFRATPGGALPSDVDIFRTITAGVPGTSMPAWAALDAEDRWALVHYLKTFSENFAKEPPPPSITIPDPPEITPAVLAEGRQFYMDAGCNACHGDDGMGNGPSAADLTDDWGDPIRPYDFTGTKPMKNGPAPQDVYRTVMTGLTGTPMPSFGDVLEPQQAWAVVSYVRSLRRPVEAVGGEDVTLPPQETLYDQVAKAASEPMASSPALIERGKTLYRSYCAICHGESGDGNGPAAGGLDPKPRDFIPGKYKFRTTPGGALPTDTDIFRTITMGLPGTTMPSWASIKIEDRWGLLHYIKTFSEAFTKEQPPPPLTMPDPPELTADLLELGKQFFIDAGCNLCHGDQGKGDGPSAADLKDDWGNPIRPYDFTGARPMKSGPLPQDVYRTVMTGLTGTPMPSFGDVLEPQQAWAVVYYVRSLRPGGSPDLVAAAANRTVGPVATPTPGVTP